MKRSLFWICIAFIMGIYIGYSYSVSITLVFSAVVLLAYIFRGLLFQNTIYGFTLIGIITSLLLGAFLITYSNDTDKRALSKYENSNVTLAADVIEKPQQKENYIEIIAMVRSVTYGKETETVKEKIRLHYTDEQPLTFGESISIRCKITRPNEALNRGGFDYSLYLKTKNIFYNAYVQNGSIQVLGNKNYNALGYIYTIRLKLVDVINNALPNQEGALLNGIVLGDKSGLNGELLLRFSRSGLSHIIAVSGMHIRYVIILLFAFLKVFGISRRKTMAITGVFIIFMTFLTGAAPSVVRASFMVLLLFLSEIFYRKSDVLTSLSFSAVVILLFNPFSAFDVGFMLSYSATLGIILYHDGIADGLLGIFGLKEREFKGKKFFESLIVLFATCLSAQLLTIPITACYFHQISVWALISNLITEPFMPFIMAAGLMMCTVGVMVPPFAMAAASFVYVFLKVTIYVANFFGGLKIGVFMFGHVTAFFVLIYGLFMILLYYVIRRQKNIWVPISSISIVLLLFISIIIGFVNQGIAQVTFINVGQGDCALISLAGNQDILIDAGGDINQNQNSRKDVGRDTVMPYLLKKGVKDIEFMIASHPHDDHIKGLISIMQEMKVYNLIIPLNFDVNDLSNKLLETAKENKVKVYVLASGDGVNFSNHVQLKTIMPDQEWVDKSKNINNNSLIVRFNYGGNSFLFLGDMEGAGEKYMVQKYRADLDVDVIKVGHHGSKTSTTKDLLEAATPKYGVISSGVNNRYGHPHKEVLDILKEHNVTIFRTDQNQDITFMLDIDKIRDIIYTKAGE